MTAHQRLIEGHDKKKKEGRRLPGRGRKSETSERLLTNQNRGVRMGRRRPAVANRGRSGNGYLSANWKFGAWRPREITQWATSHWGMW